MKLKLLGLAVVAAVTALLGAAAPASAARWDWDNYREYRFYRGHDARETRRREVLRDRSFDLADRIRLARREGFISRHDVDRDYDRLDKVREFLRHDRYLDRDEFRRRMEDLDRVEDNLRGFFRTAHRDYRFGQYYHYDWRAWEDRDRDRLDRDRDRLDRDRDRIERDRDRDR